MTQTQLPNLDLHGLVLMSLVMTAVGTPLLILVHELGHALVARRRGVRVAVVRVGGTPFCETELLGFRVEIGRWFRLREPMIDTDDGAGYVRIRELADPEDALYVALAGPLASATAGVVAAFLSSFTSGDLNTLLGLAAFAGLSSAFWNLVPRTRRRGHTDGALALYALRAMRSPAPRVVTVTVPAAADPRTSTSIAPPVPTGGR